MIGTTMIDLLEMGGAANLWISPQGKEYNCADHADWAAEQVLKIPVPDRGNGDNQAYWAARGRVYAQMFRRGWMRASAYHQENKLIIEYRRATRQQWELIYEKAGNDHLVVLDYSDNSVIIDYRQGQQPEGSPYGVWEAADPDDPEAFLRVQPEARFWIKSESGTYWHGIGHAWHIGPKVDTPTWSYEEAQAQLIYLRNVYTNAGVSYAPFERWAFVVPYDARKIKKPRKRKLKEARDPDDPEAFMAQQTDWFQTARKHGYQGTMPDNNPFNDIYEKGWQPADAPNLYSAILSVYPCMHSSSDVAAAFFSSDGSNEMLAAFRIPKTRLNAALDWWDASMANFPSTDCLPKKAEQFKHWLTSTVAEAMVECLLTEADPDDLDPEAYLVTTLDRDRQMQDLGFTKQRFNEKSSTSDYWMKYYPFDEPIMGNWGSAASPCLVPVSGVWLYELEYGYRVDEKVFAYAWACGKDGKTKSPVNTRVVRAQPLVSAVNRVVQAIDRAMASFTTKGKDADRVMREVHELIFMASQGQWTRKVAEAVDPDAVNPEAYLQALSTPLTHWLERNGLVRDASGAYTFMGKKRVLSVALKPAGRCAYTVAVRNSSEEPWTTVETNYSVSEPILKRAVLRIMRSFADAEVVPALTEAQDPDDPEDFLSWMPTDMPEWLQQVGFEARDEPHQIYPHYVRTQPPAGTIVVVYRPQFKDWYARAANMPVADAYVEGSAGTVEAKVRDWLRIQQEMVGESVDPDDPKTFLNSYVPNEFILRWGYNMLDWHRAEEVWPSVEGPIAYAKSHLLLDKATDVYIEERKPTDRLNPVCRYWLDQEYCICKEEQGSARLGEALDPDDPEAFLDNHRETHKGYRIRSQIPKGFVQSDWEPQTYLKVVGRYRVHVTWYEDGKAIVSFDFPAGRKADGEQDWCHAGIKGLPVFADLDWYLRRVERVLLKQPYTPGRRLPELPDYDTPHYETNEPYAVIQQHHRVPSSAEERDLERQPPEPVQEARQATCACVICNGTGKTSLGWCECCDGTGTTTPQCIQRYEMALV